MRICIIESLYFPPETVTKLLTSHTIIQNKKFNKKKEIVCPTAQLQCTALINNNIRTQFGHAVLVMLL